MKSKLLTLFSFIFFICLQSNVTAENGTIITYQMDMTNNNIQMTGPETIYYKNNLDQARHMRYNMVNKGKSFPMDTLLILKKNEMISVDYIRQAVMKFSDLSSMGMQDLNAQAREIQSLPDSQQIGSDVVAGEKCDIWSCDSMNATACIWGKNKNIPLRISMKPSAKFPGEMKFEATQIQNNVAIPEDKFTIPQGMKVFDANQMMSQGLGQMKQTMESNPNALDEMEKAVQEMKNIKQKGTGYSNTKKVDEKSIEKGLKDLKGLMKGW